jgi:Trypsin-like peptidase domain
MLRVVRPTVPLLALSLALVLVAGCSSTKVPGRAAGTSPAGDEAPASAPPAGPPEAPENAVLRPAFTTTTEGDVDGGTAFLARGTDDRVLLLTAQHLFGEALGMSRDYTGAELPGLVTGMTATSVDDTAVEVQSSTLITMPEAVPLTTNITRDVAGFVIDDAGEAAVLELAQAPPEPGERVWLLAEVSGSGERLFPATLEDVSPDEYLQYAFDTPLDLTATSGAPVLDADGRVVGINVGGDDASASPVRGVANSITTFRPMLEDAT